MTEPVSTLKTIVGTFTAAVVAPATADALRAAERVILGVPQSVLLVAMAGALIGVLLLPEKDAERVAADANRRRGHRLLQTAARWAALAVAVLAYAIVAAWVIAVAASIWSRRPLAQSEATSHERSADVSPSGMGAGHRRGY